MTRQPEPGELVVPLREALIAARDADPATRKWVRDCAVPWPAIAVGADQHHVSVPVDVAQAALTFLDGNRSWLIKKHAADGLRAALAAKAEA